MIHFLYRHVSVIHFSSLQFSAKPSLCLPNWPFRIVKQWKAEITGQSSASFLCLCPPVWLHCFRVFTATRRYFTRAQHFSTATFPSQDLFSSPLLMANESKMLSDVLRGCAAGQQRDIKTLLDLLYLPPAFNAAGLCCLKLNPAPHRGRFQPLLCLLCFLNVSPAQLHETRAATHLKLEPFFLFLSLFSPRFCS